MTFSDLKLSPSVLAALPSKLQSPTKIQQLAIPALLLNRDLLALAQTGSGKTLAFGLPLLDLTKSHHQSIQSVVIVPTRELAVQVADAISEVANNMVIGVLTLCGGVSQSQQVKHLALQPKIIVATPGRLLEMIKQQLIDLSQVEHLVLDEADRLLEMGFWPDIDRLLSLLPSKMQRLLFSATMPDELEQHALSLLSEPLKITSEVVNSVVDTIEEQLYLINKGSKAQGLIALLKQQQWSQVLVFANAKTSVDALCKKLTKAKINVAALHGDKGQPEREQTLADFKNNKITVLITTDLLARGIDVEALPVVINFELPPSAPVYVHRVGRTARAGRSGMAISMVCHGESEALSAIRTLTDRELTLVPLDGFEVTDQPISGTSKRAPRDKQANRRTAKKRGANDFKTKGSRH